MLNANHVAKDLLRRMARNFGVEFIRRDRVPVTTLNLLHLACLVLAETERELVLVQIGANNGIARDPVRDIVSTMQVRGILLEPVAETFLELQQNYSGYKNVVLEQAAIATADGTVDLYVPMKRENELHSHLAGFSREHLTVHGVRPENISVETVRALTLRSLLTKYSVKELDILQIDTEGFDWEIIKHALSEGIEPLILHFENCNLTPGDKLESRRQLSLHGYLLTETITDTLAVKKQILRR
jgi:FkbM family methyltransferase